MSPRSFQRCPATGQGAARTGTQEVPYEHEEKLLALRVTEHCNKLPKEVMESPSLKIFKAHLDTFLCNCNLNSDFHCCMQHNITCRKGLKYYSTYVHIHSVDHVEMLRKLGRNTVVCHRDHVWNRQQCFRQEFFSSRLGLTCEMHRELQSHFSL